MIVTCRKCGKSFDDACRFTYCPHRLFLTRDEAEQKDLGLKLLMDGKPVRFAHQRESGPSYRINACGRMGMLTLEGLAGEFAPHLFVQVEEGNP